MNVLCVDNNKITRRYVTAILKKHGHVALEAENGLQALQIIHSSNNVHLVITDTELPELSGLELIVRIDKLRLDNPPKVLIHSEIESNELSKFQEKHVLSYLLKNSLVNKPVSPGDLVANVDKLFRIRTKKDIKTSRPLC